jgi:hypothetical protein
MVLMTSEELFSVISDQSIVCDPRSQVDLLSRHESFFGGANKRLHDFLRHKPAVKVEFNLNSYTKNAIRVSGFCGEDGGIVKFTAVSLGDAVFRYG